MLLSSLLALSILLASMPQANANSELPNIGDPVDRYLSPQDEYKLGSDFHRALHLKELLIDDPEIDNYLQSLGNRLSSGIGNYQFRFFAVKDNRINAFAVPGGFIGINAGLILATRNEGELAGVMAHEIAHVTQRHIARLYAKSNASNWAMLGAFIAAIALASQGQGEGATAAIYAGTAASYQSSINHTRTHEQEADRVGIQYLSQAGFNPGDMAGFFEVMRNRSLEADQRFEMLRTHPLDANRIAETRARAEQIGIRKAPSSKRYHQIKARLATLANQSQELLSYYRTSQKEHKEIDRYAYAELLVQAGDFKSAGKVIRQLLTEHPDDIQYRLSYVRLQLAQKHFKSARKELEKMLLLYPNYMPVVVYYAQALRHQEDFEKLVSVIEHFYREQPLMPVQLYTLLAEGLNKTGSPGHSQLIQGEYYYHTGNYRSAGLQLGAALKSGELNEREKRKAETLLEEVEEKRKFR